MSHRQLSQNPGSDLRPDGLTLAFCTTNLRAACAGSPTPAQIKVLDRARGVSSRMRRSRPTPTVQTASHVSFHQHHQKTRQTEQQVPNGLHCFKCGRPRTIIRIVSCLSPSIPSSQHPLMLHRQQQLCLLFWAGIFCRSYSGLRVRDTKYEVRIAPETTANRGPSAPKVDQLDLPSRSLTELQTPPCGCS